MSENLQPNEEEVKRAKRIEAAVKTLAEYDQDFITTLEYIAILSKKNKILYSTARSMLKKEALKLLKK